MKEEVVTVYEPEDQICLDTIHRSEYAKKFHDASHLLVIQPVMTVIASTTGSDLDALEDKALERYPEYEQDGKVVFPGPRALRQNFGPDALGPKDPNP